MDPMSKPEILIKLLTDVGDFSGGGSGLEKPAIEVTRYLKVESPYWQLALCHLASVLPLFKDFIFS